MARPGRFESEGRRRKFAALVAHGVRLDNAARQARLDPWRALRLVDSPEMIDLLRECRPDATVSTLREDIANGR